jgi:hypothetical protein
MYSKSRDMVPWQICKALITTCTANQSPEDCSTTTFCLTTQQSMLLVLWSHLTNPEQAGMVQSSKPIFRWKNTDSPRALPRLAWPNLRTPETSILKIVFSRLFLIKYIWSRILNHTPIFLLCGWNHVSYSAWQPYCCLMLSTILQDTHL